MNYKQLLISVISLGFSMASYALTDHTIKTETKNYSLNIVFPQEFIPTTINFPVEQTAQTIKKQFIDSLDDEMDLPATVPGKSSLTITYEIPMQSKNFTSVRLNVSVYNRGAAHPNNYVIILNFFQGNTVELKNLFKEKSNYLKVFSQFSQKQLLKNKEFDKKWVKEGTAPYAKNFSQWYFTSLGIALVFDTYQVAAYVNGPQTVIVPLDKFKDALLPEIAKLWGI